MWRKGSGGWRAYIDFWRFFLSFFPSFFLSYISARSWELHACGNPVTRSQGTGTRLLVITKLFTEKVISALV